MAEPLSITIGLISAAISAAALAASVEARAADTRNKRSKFNLKTVGELCDRGYNAVIVSNESGSYGKGYTVKQECFHDGLTYTVYAAPRTQTMAVQNNGSGGYENWALQGTNWVRWGKIVKFHPSWNDATMGACYETRQQNHFPGWDFC